MAVPSDDEKNSLSTWPQTTGRYSLDWSECHEKRYQNFRETELDGSLEPVERSVQNSLELHESRGENVCYPWSTNTCLDDVSA